MTHKPTDESPRAVCAREYEAAGSGASGLPVRAEMDPPSQDPAGADMGAARVPLGKDSSTRPCPETVVGLPEGAPAPLSLAPKTWIIAA